MNKELTYIGHDHEIGYFVDPETLIVTVVYKKDLPRDVLLTRKLPKIQKQWGPTCFIYALVHLLREIDLRKSGIIVRTHQLYDPISPKTAQFIKMLTKEFRLLPEDPQIYAEKIIVLLAGNELHSELSHDASRILAQLEQGKVALFNFRADRPEKYEPIDIDTIQPGIGSSSIEAPILPAQHPTDYDGLHTVAVIGSIPTKDSANPLLLVVDSAVGSLSVLPWSFYRNSIVSAVLVDTPPANAIILKAKKAALGIKTSSP